MLESRMHAKTFEFSATDIANFLACPHLLTLDQAEKAGEITRPFRYDPGVELLRKLGIRNRQEATSKALRLGLPPAAERVN